MTLDNKGIYLAPRPCMASKLVYLLLSAIATASYGCVIESESCSDIGIMLPMQYDAQLPADFSVTSTLELCIGSLCDRSSLVPSTQGDAPQGQLECRDIDTQTPNFPTSCKTDPASPTTLHFDTNTAFGGHPGTDSLVLTSIDASGIRTELLRGTVTYQNATTSTSSDVCGAPFYSGKFEASGK